MVGVGVATGWKRDPIDGVGSNEATRSSNVVSGVGFGVAMRSSGGISGVGSVAATGSSSSSTGTGSIVSTRREVISGMSTSGSVKAPRVVPELEF